MQKFHPHALLLPHPNPGDNNLNEHESTLPEDPFTNATACLANWFLRRRS